MKNIVLGKRLSALYKLVDADNTHFYDLCCDHGHLGLAVYLYKQTLKITLNDKIDSICKHLLFLTSDIPTNELTVLNQDASHIKLEIKAQKFIVIAGIGGPLTIKILENLDPQLNDKDTLLLSPHTKIHEFRKYLIGKDYNLIQEEYCFENGKHYEILKVTKGNTAKKVSPVGEELWKNNDKNKAEYLCSMINYYDQKLLYTDDSNIKFFLRYLKALKNKKNSYNI